MRQLIGRLDVAHDDTADALRIIDHFDCLVAERATIAGVVRAVAALAGCDAGLHDAARGLTRRYNSEGRTLPDGDALGWSRTEVPGNPGSWVWLERAGSERTFDALILERAARAVQSLRAAPTQLLRHNPRLGARVEDFAPREVRRLFVGDYELRYEIQGEAIIIVRLWHTRENR